MDKMLCNFYEILEISPTTESSLMIVAAQTKAAQINRAFRTLSQPLERERYDDQLTTEEAIDESFYALLGIKLNADTALVLAAAQAKAIEIDKAFKILRDPQKRKMYDERLNQVTTVVTSPTRSQRPTKRYVNTVGHVSPRENIFKQWFARLADNLSTFETPSMQDIVIFVLSLLFFLYMVSLFFK